MARLTDFHRQQQLLGKKRASVRSKEGCGSLGKGKPFWFILTTTVFAK
jgi:hypothetical protein